MFPKIDITIPNTVSPNNDTGSIGRSFVFDFKTNQFVVNGGVVEETTKIQAIKQWIELYIRTELNKYRIYSDTFGLDLSDLVSYRLPREYQVSEIIRRVNEGILNYCPNVVKVTDWNFDKGHFSFTVTTDTGEEVEIIG